MSDNVKTVKYKTRFMLKNSYIYHNWFYPTDSQSICNILSLKSCAREVPLSVYEQLHSH